MTEIERELLSALETLQSVHDRQVRSLRSELEKQQSAFTQTVNGLLKQLESLNERSEQQSATISSLSKQISSLSAGVATLRTKLKV